MGEVIRATLRLYRGAFEATVLSMARCWIIAVAVVLFGGLMVVATVVAGNLGIVGGFILGAVNALLIGAMLGLVDESRLDLFTPTQQLHGQAGADVWKHRQVELVDIERRVDPERLEHGDHGGGEAVNVRDVVVN